MTKQTLILDIPDGWELTGEFRRAKEGDNYLFIYPATSRPAEARLCQTLLTDCLYPILRPAWTWPACIKPPAMWIAMDPDEIMYAFERQPEPFEKMGMWKANDGECWLIPFEILGIPPIPGPWQESLRRRPE